MFSLRITVLYSSSLQGIIRQDYIIMDVHGIGSLCFHKLMLTSLTCCVDKCCYALSAAGMSAYSQGEGVLRECVDSVLAGTSRHDTDIILLIQYHQADDHAYSV
jgi:hypothetical protein